MYTITKKFEFEAAHQLNQLPITHKCARLHGHNYIVEIVLTGESLNEYGFLIDFGDLKPLQKFIDKTLDHRNLNDILTVPTSAENIAHYLFDWCKEKWPQTQMVRVSETPHTWAIYQE